MFTVQYNPWKIQKICPVSAVYSVAGNLLRANPMMLIACAVDEESGNSCACDWWYILGLCTIFQITMAVVIPIEVPKRKVGLNVALQCNFNLPYTPKEFYKPPFWDTRSLDKESVAHDYNARSTRSIESCRDVSSQPTNKFPFEDLPMDEFYLLLQRYLLS